MKISVITACLNANAFIAHCLKSVASQTYPWIEHIIIDGVSTDETVDTIKTFPHVSILLSEPDTGIYNAMNKGIVRATGEFLIFLNADDYLVDEKVLEDVVGEIKKHPDGDIFYGSLHVRLIDGSEDVYVPARPEMAAELMVCECLPHQSTLARRSIFARTGAFDEKYLDCADHDWYLKVICDPQIKLVRLDRVVCSFREGGQSSQIERTLPEVFRIQDASPLYASAGWDRRRIKILQQHWLKERLIEIKLRQQITELQQKLSRKIGPFKRIEKKLRTFRKRLRKNRGAKWG